MDLYHFHCPNKQLSAPMCFDFSSFSFVKVMAGSGNLQTFRLLRYLRGRISAEGQVNYGLQMAVSITNSSDFFLEHVEELCIIALKEKEIYNVPVHP
jgi:hypothetical protein